MSEIHETLARFTPSVLSDLDRMVVGFTTVQSVPIANNVVISNPVHGEVYSIQHLQVTDKFCHIMIM